MTNIFRMLPGFLGGKQLWLKRLEEFRGARFVEPFAGSAVLSFNLASRARWNDSDPMMARILQRFDEQIVPEVFSREDYMRVRGQEDWWRYAYCLQRLSFSRVFSHSRNGFNVPLTGRSGGDNVRLRAHYERALARWRELAPTVTCEEWHAIPLEEYRGAVAVLDPPYEGCSAPYDRQMDYGRYWAAVEEIAGVADAVIVFDYAENLGRRIPNSNVEIRKTSAIGHNKSKDTGMAVLRSAVVPIST